MTASWLGVGSHPLTPDPTGYFIAAKIFGTANDEAAFRRPRYEPLRSIAPLSSRGGTNNGKVRTPWSFPAGNMDRIRGTRPA
jgi:hypothetical protein